MAGKLVIIHMTLSLAGMIVMLAVQDAVETVEKVPEPARILSDDDGFVVVKFVLDAIP